MNRRISTWQNGQTYGLRMVDKWTSGLGGWLFVTNNGEMWGAIIQRHQDPLPPDVQMFGEASIGKMEPEWRIPLEWARRTVVEPNKMYSALAAKSGHTETIQYSSPLTRDLGSVTYTGFERYKRRSGHSLESIHIAINAAVARARAVWNWSCTGLEVKFHDHSMAMGLAYASGSGAKNGVRKISLAAKLIESYDLNSIARVAVHELCHHYRDEKFPENKSEQHDEHFCNALKIADDEVKDYKTCKFFLNVTDATLVAAKKERVNSIEPTWSPDAGILVFYRLKTGMLRVSWIPKPGFKWSRWIRPANDSIFVELLKHFGFSDWNSVPVEISDDIKRTSLGKRFASADTLVKLAAKMTQSYSFPKTTNYIREAASL